MTAAIEAARGKRLSVLPLRYALRELRSGLRGFYVFIACIALGVMAIAGVGSVASSLSDGLAREGRTLLGGDVSFSLIQREAKPDEIAFLRSRGTVARRLASEQIRPADSLVTTIALGKGSWSRRYSQRHPKNWWWRGVATNW